MDRLVELAAVVLAMWILLVVLVAAAAACLAIAVVLGLADAWERWRVRREVRRAKVICGRCREPIRGAECERCVEDRKTLAESRAQLAPGRGPWVSR